MTHAWQTRWIDDSLHSGDSASDILASVASLMWKEGEQPKETLSYRVWTYLRASIDPKLPDDEFLERLAELELVEIISKPH